MTPYQLLLLGGRSGVGKTTVAFEVSRRLAQADVAHCLIDGDNLSHVHPPPSGDPSRTVLTEQNLSAVWQNYAVRGYSRLIYTNTVSVLEPDLVVRAMGGAAQTTAVLLTARDETVEQRLRLRESGGALTDHLRRSASAAARLEAAAEPSVVRVGTDGRSIEEISAEVVDLTRWMVVKTGGMDRAWAEAFAEQWARNWNAHDLEAVLSQFADDVVFTSPVAARVVPGSDGVVRGKEALRACWRAGLSKVPDLHFEIVSVFVGIDILVLAYRNQRADLVSEVLEVEDGLVVRGHGTYLTGGDAGYLAGAHGGVLPSR